MPLIFIIAYILIEITLFSLIGSLIGTLPMIMLVIAGFFVGSYLIRTSGHSLASGVSQMQQQINSRQISAAISRSIGGLLLIIPGFFTDFLGLLIMFEPTRHMLAKLFKFKTVNMQQHTSNRANDDIIEGEIIDEDQKPLN